MNIVNRQTFIFSLNCSTLNNAANPSIINANLNLGFAANGLILKSISYIPYILDPTDPSSDLCDYSDLV